MDLNIENSFYPRVVRISQTAQLTSHQLPRDNPDTTATRKGRTVRARHRSRSRRTDWRTSVRSRGRRSRTVRAKPSNMSRRCRWSRRTGSARSKRTVRRTVRAWGILWYNLAPLLSRTGMVFFTISTRNLATIPVRTRNQKLPVWTASQRLSAWTMKISYQPQYQFNMDRHYILDVCISYYLQISFKRKRLA